MGNCKTVCSKDTKGKRRSAFPVDAIPEVEVGKNAAVRGGEKKVIFIFGGPGSKKGLFMSNLETSYGFFIIKVQQLFFALSKKSKASELQTIFSVVLEFLDNALPGVYVVDILPNIHNLVQVHTVFSQCDEQMNRFELQYPISFIIDLQYTGAVALSNIEGYYSCDIDEDFSELRMIAYNTLVKPLLNYFRREKKCLTIYISSKSINISWNQLVAVLTKMGFKTTVNLGNIFYFAFDKNEVEHMKNVEGVMHISLKLIVEDATAAPHQLISLLCDYINEHAVGKLYIINLEETSINPGELEKITNQPAISFNMNKEDLTYEMKTQNPNIDKIGMAKVVLTASDDIYLFSTTADNNFCKKVVLLMSSHR